MGVCKKRKKKKTSIESKAQCKQCAGAKGRQERQRAEDRVPKEIDQSLNIERQEKRRISRKKFDGEL